MLLVACYILICAVSIECSQRRWPTDHQPRHLRRKCTFDFCQCISMYNVDNNVYQCIMHDTFYNVQCTVTMLQSRTRYQWMPGGHDGHWVTPPYSDSVSHQQMSSVLSSLCIIDNNQHPSPFPYHQLMLISISTNTTIIPFVIIAS